MHKAQMGVPARGSFTNLRAKGTSALTPNQPLSPACSESDPFIWVDGGKMETVCYKMWKGDREPL